MRHYTCDRCDVACSNTEVRRMIVHLFDPFPDSDIDYKYEKDLCKECWVALSSWVDDGMRGDPDA